jgi:hypothetical protein
VISSTGGRAAGRKSVAGVADGQQRDLRGVVRDIQHIRDILLVAEQVVAGDRAAAPRARSASWKLQTAG